VSGDSTSDLVNVWNHEFGEHSAQLDVKKSRFAIGQARWKLKMLEEYENVVRVKKLKSDVEKRRSDELAARATGELEESKLLKLQRSRNLDKTGVLFTDSQERLMTYLVRAIPVEERWSEQLDRIEKSGQSGDAVRREVADLTSQLKAIIEKAQTDFAAAIEKAQIDYAAAALARLKGTIHWAANRRIGN
jgi:hypothetical protein